MPNPKTQATPGPWRAQGRMVVTATSGRLVAACHYGHEADDPTAEEAFSRARLIAAAPQMRDALEEVVAQLMRCSDLNHFPLLACALDDARAALRAANGEKS